MQFAESLSVAVPRVLAVVMALTSAGVLHGTMIVCASATGAVATAAAPVSAAAVRPPEIDSFDR
ncbi:hypothetical protein GCM10027176_18390 [Actinoallomurus bryophytorum]